AKQSPIAFVAAGSKLLGGARRAHGAAGVLHVPAILEAAGDAQLVDVEEAALGRAPEAGRWREVANAGRIDDRRSCIQRVPARRGGGMPTLHIAGQLGSLRR